MLCCSVVFFLCTGGVFVTTVRGEFLTFLAASKTFLLRSKPIGDMLKLFCVCILPEIGVLVPITVTR